MSTFSTEEVWLETGILCFVSLVIRASAAKMEIKFSEKHFQRRFIALVNISGIEDWENLKWLLISVLIARSAQMHRWSERFLKQIFFLLKVETVHIITIFTLSHFWMFWMWRFESTASHRSLMRVCMAQLNDPMAANFSPRGTWVTKSNGELQRCQLIGKVEVFFEKTLVFLNE